MPSIEDYVSSCCGWSIFEVGDGTYECNDCGKVCYLMDKIVTENIIYLNKMPTENIYQVYYENYEGIKELLGTFNDQEKARSLMRNEALYWQEYNKIELTNKEPDYYAALDPEDGYSEWWSVVETKVK